MDFLIWHKFSNLMHSRLRRIINRSGIGFLKNILRIIQTNRFKHNLLLLHDILENTEFSVRYWIWGGLLLGWAREGQLLPHDIEDADFAYLHEDRDKFLNNIDAIINSGFIPTFKFVNNLGITTEYSFMKDGARFDFFEMYKAGDKLCYWLYYYSDSEKFVALCKIPIHGLTKIEFLGMVWQKPDDHDTHLSAIYGNWRIPDPNYIWFESEKSIVSISEWKGTLDWK